MPTPLRVLWVATKAPWPPVDGGRLLLWTTLGALHEAGAQITLVAPFFGSGGGGGDDDSESMNACVAKLREICRPVLVPSRLRAAAVDAVRSVLSGRPWTLARHLNPQVARRVAAELEAMDFDAVVAEQVQALAQIPPKHPNVPPVVLRAQNVESDLWQALASAGGQFRLLRWWLGRQARRLAAAEARAVRRCAATAALTDHDAQVLRELARDGSGVSPRVSVIPAAARVQLPPGPVLEGEPAVVLFGSAGWRPNAEGAREFVERDWPAIRADNPGAVLHLFGDLLTSGAARTASEDGLRLHPAPDDSATALAAGSILVVPLAVASGVRMKILEAWARGVVVVASPAAARGLGATHGSELLVAEGSAAWAGAVSQAVTRYDELRGAARNRLRDTYAPDVVARRWLDLLGESTVRSPAGNES